MRTLISSNCTFMSPHFTPTCFCPSKRCTITGHLGIRQGVVNQKFILHQRDKSYLLEVVIFGYIRLPHFSKLVPVSLDCVHTCINTKHNNIPKHYMYHFPLKGYIFNKHHIRVHIVSYPVILWNEWFLQFHVSLSCGLHTLENISLYHLILLRARTEIFL